MKRPRRLVPVLVLLGLLLLAAAGTAGLGWYVFPLQAAEVLARGQLWRGGVREVRAGGLHGYLADHCGAAGAECRCVALIHGLGDTALTWKRVLLQSPVEWSVPVRVYAFDLPGSGDSPPPADPAQYRVRLQAERVRGVLSPLCPAWLVLGNSLGGWIATWLALDWPQGVRALLVLDGAGLHGETQQLSARSLTEPTVASLKDFQRRAYYRGRDLPERVWRAAVLRMKQGNAGNVVAAQVPDDLLDEHLPRLHVPTLVFWGAADRVIPIDDGRRMAALIPGARLIEGPRCGHLPQKECPAQVLPTIHELFHELLTTHP